LASGEKILLLNSNLMTPPVAPIALDYLASALVEHGYSVDVLDLCFSADPFFDIKNYFRSQNPLLVGITLRNTDDTSFATRDFFLPLVKEMVDAVRMYSSAPIVIGGSGFSVSPQAVLEFCSLDMGIWGEGEMALPLLADRIASGADYCDVPGIVYRTEEGFRRTPPQNLYLAAQPAPRRNAIDNRRYFAEGGMGGVETKRGCPKRCSYCADPLCRGNKVRMRSPHSVVDEMEALLALGIDHIHICDSEFNYPYDHARDVCREIIARGLGTRVRWYAYCSPTPFDEDLARLFVKSGCAGVNFGVDSASDRMLQALGRDFTAEDVMRTAIICRLRGLVFMYDLLLGGPGETRDSLRETIETMRRLEPSRVGANLGVRIYPRTSLARMVLAQGPVASNPNVHGERDGSFLAPVFYLSSELGTDVAAYLDGLIGGDERFLFMSGSAADSNYNYNDNSLLVKAIKDGYRGAFWDILRRLAVSQ
jgi:radical SAM superfamily enzyme YgiQ (UPF0313 family)